MSAARSVASIRRHLQATSLLAALAGYVVLLLVNRQLSTRVRHERHAAQVQETTRLLQELLPEQTDTMASCGATWLIWPAPLYWCGWCGSSLTAPPPPR